MARPVVRRHPSKPETLQPPELKLVEEPKLEDLTVDVLYRMAQEADIDGRSSMTKDELVAALS